MSGLEVMAAVAGIISAFTGSATLYRQWRKKKIRRLINVQNEGLQRSLSTGETTIRREYDAHFARLGQRFAVGDDRARAELSQYVIKLQHAIITLMSESGSNGLTVLPGLPMMLSASEDTRTGVVTALGEQYQRLLQSAPRAMAGFLAPYRQEQASESREGVPRRRSGSVDDAPLIANRWDPCPGPIMLDSLGYWQCRHCRFKVSDSGVDETLTIETTDDDTLGIAVKALWDWHETCERVGRGEYYYKCKICKPRGRGATLSELVYHLSHRHTTDDVVQVLRDDARFLYLERPGDDKEQITTLSDEIYDPSRTRRILR